MKRLSATDLTHPQTHPRKELGMGYTSGPVLQLLPCGLCPVQNSSHRCINIIAKVVVIVKQATCLFGNGLFGNS